MTQTSENSRSALSALPHAALRAFKTAMYLTNYSNLCSDSWNFLDFFLRFLHEITEKPKNVASNSLKKSFFWDYLFENIMK